MQDEDKCQTRVQKLAPGLSHFDEHTERSNERVQLAICIDQARIEDAEALIRVDVSLDALITDLDFELDDRHTSSGTECKIDDQQWDRRPAVVTHIACTCCTPAK